jgi:HEPN domain-containing protein
MSEAQLWLVHAQADLRAVEVLLTSELYGLASFHAQQAVEKTLKAKILLKTGQLPRVHDLVVLAERCGETFDPDILITFEELSVLYTGSRYPGGWGSGPAGQPSAKKVQAYLIVAQQLLNDTTC